MPESLLALHLQLIKRALIGRMDTESIPLLVYKSPFARTIAEAVPLID